MGITFGLQHLVSNLWSYLFVIWSANKFNKIQSAQNNGS